MTNPSYPHLDPHPWADPLVHRDPAAFQAYAAKLATSDLTIPDWHMPVYPDLDDARFVQFLGVQNALNSCFADPTSDDKFAVSYAGVSWAGAMGLCAALMRSADEGFDLLDPLQLARLDLTTAAHLFRSETSPLPLLAERVALLNSLPVSLARYNGSFATLFAACAYDALRIIDTLVSEFPAYSSDRWLHPETKQLLTFDKRARLLPLMYEGRARSSDGALPTLSNIAGIGPVVDYQLPRALRADGVIVYSDTLAHAVDQGQLLPPGSIPELAIRCVTHAVIEDLVTAVSDLRSERVTMLELDYIMWVTGRKAAGRHHLTLTTAY